MERERGTIERGIILTATAAGYTIASLDRDGIETPPLKTIQHGQAGTTPPTYAVGDTVYYFIFKDGTGRIICGI